MAHTTALGQHWDAQGPGEEDEYWKVVQAKSTPFYAEAIHVGALVGGASDETAGSLRDFGVVLGELIQIRDDLFDAFKRPANPDWVRGSSLPILYARLVEHDYHAQFAELLPRAATESEALEQAQEILIRCGRSVFAFTNGLSGSPRRTNY
jgi:geranylgeranyl pyrophosphate synthase